MNFQSHVLTDSEKEQIHNETLQILERTGAKFHSEKVLKLLEANGARVDFEKKIASIPSELIQQALKTTPSSFVLGARNPEFDYSMPSPVTRFRWTAPVPLRWILTLASTDMAPQPIMKKGCASFRRWIWVSWRGRLYRRKINLHIHVRCMNGDHWLRIARNMASMKFITSSRLHFLLNCSQPFWAVRMKSARAMLIP